MRHLPIFVIPGRDPEPTITRWLRWNRRIVGSGYFPAGKFRNDGIKGRMRKVSYLIIQLSHAVLFFFRQHVISEIQQFARTAIAGGK